MKSAIASYSQPQVYNCGPLACNPFFMYAHIDYSTDKILRTGVNRQLGPPVDEVWIPNIRIYILPIPLINCPSSQDQGEEFNQALYVVVYSKDPGGVINWFINNPAIAPTNEVSSIWIELYVSTSHWLIYA